MYYHGVSKTFNNVSKRRRIDNRSPTVHVAFYFSENLSISKKKISTVTYYLYKFFRKKYYKRKFYCEKCFNSFQALQKSKSDRVSCPYCE